jgi:Ca-activated chloride channel family protein
MHIRSTAAGLLAGLALLSVPAGAQKITVATQSVPIYATVTDSQRRLIGDLVREDFEVYDNGVLQTISQFTNEPTPFTAALMLDTSASMTLNLDLVKHSAEEFLLRLLPDDRAKVGAFNDKIEIHPEEGPFIGDRDRLIRILKNDLDFGNGTKLYDAIDRGIVELKPIDGRRVVVVFTDGDDFGSRLGLGDAIERARIDNVMVYAIGLESDYFNGAQRVRSRPDRGLKRLADETGGGFFELKKTAELGPTFTRVAQELHSQYVIGFSPATWDGKVHKLEVRVKKPGMTARGRKSYVAAAAGTTTEKPR